LEGKHVNFPSPVSGQQTNTREAIFFESRINQDEPSLPVAKTSDSFFQLHGRYILCSVKSGLMIIDQQLAHERVLYEKYLQQMKGTPGASQQSLFPQSITLSAADYTLLMEMNLELAAMGFRLEIFGKNTVLIQGTPAGTTISERELIEGLLEQFKINQSEWQLPVQESLARALARRIGIRSGQVLQPEEMKSLVASLWSCIQPNFSPDGTPTFFTFDTSKIESYFTR
jgi:DNA mismatch repair protein MutL